MTCEYSGLPSVDSYSQDKEEQKKLLIEMMEADEKDGLYEQPKKQTAVEWLLNDLFPERLEGFSDEEWDKINQAFEQAKQIEKEQITDAFKYGWNWNYDAEQYYNQTYNQNK